MALDAQRNWDLEMEEELAKMRLKNGGDESHEAKVQDDDQSRPLIPPKTPFHLPTEIVLQVVAYIPSGLANQQTLHSLCLVSRQWYSAAISNLYARPYLIGRNFDKFVATICPPSGAHGRRRTELADFVRRLDMGRLIHHGSKSTTAKLLGRVKGGLEQFVAPQVSFGINCFAPISKCINLKYLDLAIVSDNIPFQTLFHSIGVLNSLEVFIFPRSPVSVSNFDASIATWPPNLVHLCLGGEVSNAFLLRVANFPNTLTTLTIDHCTNAENSGIRSLLETTGPNLQRLTLSDDLPRVVHPFLDDMLALCPVLTYLRIPSDYLSSNFFYQETGYSHPLHELHLDAVSTVGARVTPYDLVIAIDHTKTLRNLRKIAVAEKLWNLDDPAVEGSLSELVDLVDRLAEEDTKAGVQEVDGDIWLF